MLLKLLLMSLVFAPVMLGIWMASSRRGRQGFPLLVGVLFIYSVFYLLLLYFVRYRWL